MKLFASLLVVALLVTGCGGGASVKMGTTPVTALAPSHTFDYGNPENGGPPPDFSKGGVPGKPGKK
jgi:hypothetical protein